MISRAFQITNIDDNDNGNDNTFIEHKYRLQMKIYIYIYIIQFTIYKMLCIVFMYGDQ